MVLDSISEKPPKLKAFRCVIAIPTAASRPRDDEKMSLRGCAAAVANNERVLTKERVKKNANH
jgi:hypothetical protein